MNLNEISMLREGAARHKIPNHKSQCLSHLSSDFCENILSYFSGRQVCDKKFEF